MAILRHKLGQLADEKQDHHDLKQLPYTGKKLKPSSLRKDYWAPMAWINFNPGHGEVGRSVFQKLRELKHLHEVAWGDDMLYKTYDEYTEQEKKGAEKAMKEGRVPGRPIRSKRERGIAINAQKKNSIADMAVVLAGKGPGNKMKLKNLEEGGEGLAGVTVRWANNYDRNYAAKWSHNVAHEFVEGEDIIQVKDGAMTVRARAPPPDDGTTAATAEKGSPRGEPELAQ